MLLDCPRCHRKVSAPSGPSGRCICLSCGHSFSHGTALPPVTAEATRRKIAPNRESKLAGSGIGQAIREQPRLGPYIIVAELGRGGMGRVFKAVHETLRQTRAIKILTKSASSDPKTVSRFQREARIIAEVNHENIVRIFDFEQDPERGHYYFVMEYVDGGSVSKILARQGSLPWLQAAEITLQVAYGLAAMHEHRLVHRDVKPSNILIDRAGRAKVADLGLARHEGEGGDTQLTIAGSMMGTVDYVAPEQIVDARMADIRSDLYALGCSLFHMLAGRVPFHDGSAYQKMQQHIHDPLPNIGPLAPDVPFQLVLILNRLTEKDPANRYQTPHELIADLECLTMPKVNETVDWHGSVVEQLRAIAEAAAGDRGPITATPASDLFSENDSVHCEPPSPELVQFLNAVTNMREDDTAEVQASETLHGPEMDPQFKAFVDAVAREAQSSHSYDRFIRNNADGWWARSVTIPFLAILLAALVVVLLIWLLR